VGVGAGIGPEGNGMGPEGADGEGIGGWKGEERGSSAGEREDT